MKIKQILGTATLASTILLAAAVLADTQLTVAVFDKFQGSSELIAGDYPTAAKQTLSASRVSGVRGSNSLTEAQLLSNLCIADIKSEQLIRAKKSCRKAVSVASSLSTGIGVSRAEVKSIKATAYNNRGVLRALSADRSGAISDFTKAARLNPQALENRQNLSAALAMDNTGTVAQVDIRN